jgi:hypothetical protein
VYKLSQGLASRAAALPAPPSGWCTPRGIFVDHATSNVYVADSNHIVVIPGGTGVAQTITDARFSTLMDVFIDTNGTLWAADQYTGVFTIDLSASSAVVTAVTTVTWLQPMAVAVSTVGDVFVSDWGVAGVVKIGAWGAGAVSYITNGLSQPMGLWLSPTNDLYVTEFNNMLVWVYRNGSDAPSNMVNVPITERPTDIAGGPRGTLWVTEQGSGGGLFESDSVLGASVGAWNDLQGVWVDCSVDASQTRTLPQTLSQTPSPSPTTTLSSTESTTSTTESTTSTTESTTSSTESTTSSSESTTSSSESTTTSSESTTSTTECFRPHAKATMLSGQDVKLEDLKLGDQVLAVENGKIISTTILCVIHMKKHVWTNFVIIKVQGTQLEVTPDHYIYIKGKTTHWSDRHIIPAREAQAGQLTWVQRGKHLKLETILDVNQTMLQGVGNVMTENGNIIVDGLAASVYTDMAGSEDAMHQFAALARIIYRIYPKFLETLTFYNTGHYYGLFYVLSWKHPDFNRAWWQDVLVRLAWLPSVLVNPRVSEASVGTNKGNFERSEL